MVPTTSVPISRLWKYTMHAAAGLMVAIAGAAFTGATAQAGEGGFGWYASSRVDTVLSASPTPPSTMAEPLTRYNFTVVNTSTPNFAVFASTLINGGPIGFFTPDEPYIVDWEVPLLPNAGVVQINSPMGWDYEIVTVGNDTANGWDGVAKWLIPGDPFYQGPNSPFTDSTLDIIHWYSVAWVVDPMDLSDAISPFSSLPGFSIDSNDPTPVDGPYQASWDFLEVVSGDPPLPNNAPFGLPGTLTQVPEPGILMLFGVGLAGLALSRRRRKV